MQADFKAIRTTSAAGHASLAAAVRDIERVLRDGARVGGADPAWRIRRIDAQDGVLLDAFFKALTPQSRRLRFHAGLSEVPAKWLQRFTHADAEAELGLVATAWHEGREVCIGEARYVLTPDAPGAREFALVVADDWQGKGVGHGLLQALTRHARRRGVEVMHGDVLRDNTPMLQLARRLGYRSQAHPDEPTLRRVVVALSRANRTHRTSRTNGQSVAGRVSLAGRPKALELAVEAEPAAPTRFN
jgi:GNAT superfamily N-acetyltransferase